MKSKSTRESAQLSTGGCPQDGPRRQPALLEIPLPDYICPQAWSDFVAMRRERRSPLTQRAAMLVVKRLMALRSEGYCPTAALEKSVRCGWLDVYPSERLAAPAAQPASPPQVRAVEPMSEATRARIRDLRRRVVESDGRWHPTVICEGPTDAPPR